MYSLLYGSSVNPYYNMDIGKSFIINNVLYMTLSLPLKHHRAPIMSLYGLNSYYMPTNMSDYKTTSSAYTKLEISHPYLLLSNDQFALLDDNMDINIIQYDHMYVQTTPMLRSDKPTKAVTSILLNMQPLMSSRQHVCSCITIR